MNIAITGHRPKDLLPEWKDLIRANLIYQFDWYDPEFVIVGMAEGIDLYAAEIALAGGYNIIAAVPYDGHIPSDTERRERYRHVLDEASEVTVVSPGPYAVWKFHARNEWMVDRAQRLVAVWTGKESGGTYATVKYAKRVGCPITHINPKDATITLL